jgi:hypothetical protein
MPLALVVGIYRQLAEGQGKTCNLSRDSAFGAAKSAARRNPVAA